jgi:putative membrane protein
MKQYISLIIKGMGMGAANVIPGVSGGTIALITGILERLLDAIKSFNIKAFKLIIKGRFKEFAAHVDLWFLLAVFSGIGIAILSLARLLEYLFEHYPIHVWAFFFGLILASVYYISRMISRLNIVNILFYLTGIGIAVWIALMDVGRENDSTAYLFICGIVAICAMILPGISGSFILLIMGNYQLVMIDAVNDLNIKILIPVAVGSVAGLLGFSHLLSWVYKKFRDQTTAILSGFILGSLWILWPWKHILSTYTDRHGEVLPLKQENVLPGSFEQLTGNDSFLIPAIILAIAGILVIVLTETLAGKDKQLKN